MEIAGLILTIVGAVILFAGALGLRFHRAANSEKEESGVDEIVDHVYFGGLISFFSELSRATGEVIKNRSSSPLFSLVILMGFGVAMLSVGLLLSWWVD